MDSDAVAENVGPAELEHAILKPQFNPLCGEIVTKLLAKNLQKLTSVQDPSYCYDDFEPEGASTIQYEWWNSQLAKKLAAMFKVYRKFCRQHGKKDPLAEKDGDVEEEEKESQEAQDDEGLTRIRKRTISKDGADASLKTVTDPFTCASGLEDQAQMLARFENDHAHSWSLETLQLVRLFEKDLDERDPFFIPGQQVKPATKPANPY